MSIFKVANHYGGHQRWCTEKPMNMLYIFCALAKGDRLSKTNFTKDKDFGESIYNSCLGWETGQVS